MNVCSPQGRMGITTGTCATAASLMAALRLLGEWHRNQIPVRLPDGSDESIPVLESGCRNDLAWAVVRKDAGDDPDVTHCALVRADVRRSDTPGVRFLAGKGVGTVTRPGLQIPPGEPAINPTPRRMISDHLLALGPAWEVTLSVKNGEALAQQTFNPRLGIVGGLSILGTSGRVRPFNHQSQLCSIHCAVGVGRAAQLQRWVLVPGHFGEKAARDHYRIPSDLALLEVGNDWGYALDLLCAETPQAVLLVGHPGKLAKLSQGYWDTHSSRSPSALPGITAEWCQAGHPLPPNLQTVEGFCAAIQDHPAAQAFFQQVAEQVANAVAERFKRLCPVAVSLCDMRAEIYGESTEILAWK
ncbi:MAG TPA: cobalt-precorrin-5B (C(1))-methyltransferase CbiD [Fibrobacteraceae bacterium]|nr:cobalt-precorrin-5B (C(1))-methyltransferase CbiD [Fibrobacteraceae bacterium]